MAPFSLGVAAYAVTLARFDFEQLRAGRGDQWIAGGALAISTLACGEMARALIAHRAWGGEPLRIGTIVLWALSVAWLPALLFTELRWPRLGYNLARGGTVFPLGMYAVMSATAGEVASLRLVIDLGRAMAWIAFAAWCVLAAERLGAPRPLRAERRRADHAISSPYLGSVGSSHTAKSPSSFCDLPARGSVGSGTRWTASGCARIVRALSPAITSTGASDIVVLLSAAYRITIS